MDWRVFIFSGAFKKFNQIKNKQIHFLFYSLNIANVD